MTVLAILTTVVEKLASLATEEAWNQICLVANLKKEVENLITTLKGIRAVLVDAEQLQFERETVRFWLDRLKDMSYDIEDVLEEWNTGKMKLQIEGGHENVDANVEYWKVCCLRSPCFCIKRGLLLCDCFFIEQGVLRCRIALKIKQTNKDLENITKLQEMVKLSVDRICEIPRREESTSVFDLSEIRGRRVEKQILVNMLLSESSNPRKGPRVISIVGMSGIGKTTLAQLAYNDDDITTNFNEKMWVCVSHPFDESKIAKAILESPRVNNINLTNSDPRLEDVRHFITGKRFFLVLDDVWIEDRRKWKKLYQYLKGGAPGSKILVTTCKEAVTRAIKSDSSDVLNIKELSNDDCLSLFENLAFPGKAREEREELKEIGRGIVNKCNGLPLAAVTMGDLLYLKKDKIGWKTVLDDKMWELQAFKDKIFPRFFLSYDGLPYMVKLCFSYCAIFPKDWKIDRKELIYLWMAQGYLSSNSGKEMQNGEEYFDTLVARYFFREFENDGYNVTYKMHDIVHDVALFLSQNECLAVEDFDFENLWENSSYHKTRHLMIKSMKKISPVFKSKLEKIRSLLIYNSSYSVEYDQFTRGIEKLPFLRALRFDCNLVKKVPMEIAKLIYLKYLHLIVGEDIEALPDALCELYNLQTLRIEGRGLKRLPQKMEKLIELRHLEMDDLSFWELSYMPKGIERLTGLQILSHFIVHVSGDNSNNACGLEGLKNLNTLRGSLYIYGLGNVRDKSEIEGAKFGDKKNLVELRLDFSGTMAGHNSHKMLLQAFQRLPPKLEALWICEYRGDIIFPPNWMMSLNKLKKLDLSSCENWKCLPALGNWQSLESLAIGKMKGIKRVSNEFLGVESGVGSSSLSLPSDIFPKLKTLQFSDMENWEEWDYGITGTDEKVLTLMPCLRSLIFNNCPKLQALPEELCQRTTLDELKLKGIVHPILKKRCKKWIERKQTQRLPLIYRARSI